MTSLSRPNPRALLFVAALALLAGALWWVRVGDVDPADYHVRKGNYRLEDGRPEEAIAEFDTALLADADHVYAQLGRAIALLQAGRPDDALDGLDRIVETRPGFAPAYAERGILLDRIGRHEDALAAYRRALELDPDGFEGPGWVWRFLHNVAAKPPTIRDRADYLEKELAKPPEERVLRLPEEDEKQRMYKAS
jgi:tetratricopeptide (TPR) repeat protein